MRPGTSSSTSDPATTSGPDGTSGGSSGGSGAARPACDGSFVVRERFDVDISDQDWNIQYDPAKLWTEIELGTLLFQADVSMAEAVRPFWSMEWTGTMPDTGLVGLEIVAAPAALPTNQLLLGLRDGTGSTMYVEFNGGTLLVIHYDSTQPVETAFTTLENLGAFDATAYRWLRGRYDRVANTVAFDASPDGQSWTPVLASTPSLIDLQTVVLRIGAGTEVPGTTEFARIDDVFICDES